MPTGRIQLLDTTRPQLGLWLTGPTDRTPAYALRRARGLHASCDGALRPRPGLTTLYTQTHVHSLVRFADTRFFAAGGTLYRAGTPVLAGLDGTRLALVRVPPAQGLADSLFVAGGGLLRKIDAAGTVTHWGIAAPPDGFTVSKNAQLTRDIEHFDSHATFTLAGTGVTKADEAIIKQFGTNAIKVDVPSNTIGTLRKAITIDLAQFAAPGDSSNEDLLEFWLRVDNAQFSAYVALRFDVGNGNFASNYYQYKFFPTASTPVGAATTTQGVAATATVRDRELAFVQADGRPVAHEAAAQAVEGPGTTEYGAATATWTRLRAPKALFMRSGSSAATWNAVVAIELTFATTNDGAATFYIDRLRMVGGAGLLGKYAHRVTFRNSTTGNRSNANPTPVETLDVDRTSLALANLPLSVDAQVTQREIWRTLGNGALFFRAHTVNDNTTLTATDATADYVGLNSQTGAQRLEALELPLDNAPPDATWDDAVAHTGTVFALNNASGKRGRLYYTPHARPEAQKGFIDVTDDDDPLQRIVVWNGVRYAVSEARFFRVDGSDPYVARDVFGVPGVLAAHKHTLTPTPYGVAWQAADGVRLFTGTRSELLHFERLGPLFRGEALEQLSAFEGVVAAYARDQYYVSDGTQGLAFNLRTGMVRDLGLGFTAAHYEDDTGLLLIGNATGVHILEDEDAPGNTAIVVESAASLFLNDAIGYVDEAYVDTDIVGNVDALLDSTTYALGATGATVRRLTRFALERPCRSASLRFTGAGTPTQALYGLELATRPLECLVRAGTQTFAFTARTETLSAGVAFDFAEETAFLSLFAQGVLIRRLLIDVTLNGAMLLPTVVYANALQALAPITDSARRTVEWSPGRMARPIGLLLAGNFTTPIVVYRCEIDLYIPTR